MMNFEDLVRGYEREGDKEALLNLRTIWIQVSEPHRNAHPSVAEALLLICSRRVVMIDEALRRMDR
jgi:hypothetical protein